MPVSPGNFIERSDSQRFDGDWLLALAAYNAGAARVQRAIRKNRNSGKPVDFWQLQLPKETRNYVPKLLALRSLIESPEAYGLKLPTVPDAPWVRHRIRYGDTLSTIARHYRIPVVRLREFNRLPDSRIVACDLLIVPVAHG